MNRREFITQSCLTCLSAGILPAVLSGCQSAHYASGVIDATGISIAQSEFVFEKKGQPAIRQFIVIHHEKLEFPIYLYRINDSTYSALWMRCTHQGSELNASGDHLYCTSHGSEFDFNGKVKQGPAEKNLRTFKTSVQDEKILIELT